MLLVRRYRLLVVLVCENFINLLIKFGLKDGHSIGFDSTKAGILQLLQRIRVPTCLFSTFPLAEYDSSWRMPRTHLFVAQEVLLDSGNGGEDFGVLVAPVRLEVFDARLRLAMDEDHPEKLDLCDSWAWWAMVEWDLAYVQVVVMQVIHGNVRYRARLRLLCRTDPGTPLLPSIGLHQGFT